MDVFESRNRAVAEIIDDGNDQKNKTKTWHWKSGQDIIDIFPNPKKQVTPFHTRKGGGFHAHFDEINIMETFESGKQDMEAYLHKVVLEKWTMEENRNNMTFPKNKAVGCKIEK